MHSLFPSALICRRFPELALHFSYPLRNSTQPYCTRPWRLPPETWADPLPERRSCSTSYLGGRATEGLGWIWLHLGLKQLDLSPQRPFDRFPLSASRVFTCRQGALRRRHPFWMCFPVKCHAHFPVVQLMRGACRWLWDGIPRGSPVPRFSTLHLLGSVHRRAPQFWLLLFPDLLEQWQTFALVLAIRTGGQYLPATPWSKETVLPQVKPVNHLS